MKRIYLDHQATTPPSASVVEAMTRHLIEFPGNPHSSDHSDGWRAANALEAARMRISAAVGGDDSDAVLFTSGATEANNLALMGVARRDGRTRVVVSAIEHLAVLGPARALARAGFELVVVPCGSDGIVDADEFSSAVDERTLVASLMLVNNEIGTLQPVEAVGRRCRSTGAMFHVDAAQALRWSPIDVHRLGCTSLSLSAHKMGGPPGIGALWIDDGLRDRLTSMQHGGEQEGGLRPGTVPGFLASGFAQAVDELPGEIEVDLWRARTQRLWAAVQEAVPGAMLNGALEPRHPGNLNVRLPATDADAIIAALQPIVAVSHGSACTSGMPEPSHVLRAIGLTADEAGRSFRISTAPNTTDEEFADFVDMLGEAVERLSQNSKN